MEVGNEGRDAMEVINLDARGVVQNGRRGWEVLGAGGGWVMSGPVGMRGSKAVEVGVELCDGIEQGIGALDGGSCIGRAMVQWCPTGCK